MRICAKSLYPAPLLDIEITAKQVLEEIQAVLILVKIIDSAQEKYKAIPNEQYKLTQRGTLKLGSAFFI